MGAKNISEVVNKEINKNPCLKVLFKGLKIAGNIVSFGIPYSIKNKKKQNIKNPGYASYVDSALKKTRPRMYREMQQKYGDELFKKYFKKASK